MKIKFIMIFLLALYCFCFSSVAHPGFQDNKKKDVSVLVLVGEWFGDAYFPLKEEINRRGWLMKRVGIDAEYRGCYNKARDVVLRSDILIPDIKDFHGFDCLIIPSGPQWRKFNQNTRVLQFIRDAHTAGLLIASFCVGNKTVSAAGLVDSLSGLNLFPEKVTLVRERILLGPRGGGPPPGDGYKSAPIKELCDRIALEIKNKKDHGTMLPLDGPYLGQKPPGMTPKIFALGIISTGMSESSIAVTPDGNEIFYSVLAGNCETIITTKFENGRWTAPEVAPFSGKYLDGFPSIHPDGSKLYFHSYRPLDGGLQISDVVNIWFVEKKGTGWSEPKPIGPPINGDGFVCCPSVTKTGAIYYSKKTKDGGEKIYRSRFVNGKYLKPEELPHNVNREKEQFHAVISPDESYLIMPYKDYFVSFRDQNDHWSDLIKLGDVVNKEKSGYCPSISSDGKYFFFAAYPNLKWHQFFDKRHTYKDLQEITLKHPASQRTDIYWVDTKIIEELKPVNLK